jgi:hypothetical protein
VIGQQPHQLLPGWGISLASQGGNLRKYVITLGAALGLLALSATAMQAASAQGVGGVAPPAGAVSATPVTSTPHLKATADNPTQQIRQLVQCGNTMYAVGYFTTIVRQSSTYTRSDIVSFSATAPYTVTSLAPTVVGSDINSIAFNGSNCADAYIGGSFTSVNGTSVKNVAEISTTTGNVVTAFAHSAAGSVQTMRQQRRPVLHQPEPGHGQGRRVPEAEHLGELQLLRRVQQRDPGVQPGTVPQRPA